jgi:hypothetical protein
MSGLEAIAIIGVVASLITAFKDSSAILSKVKVRRRLKEGALPPTVELEEVLAEGEQEIQRAAAAGIRRFGPTFVEEDREFTSLYTTRTLWLTYAVEAKLALQTVVIEVQASMLRDLSIAVQDDTINDFSNIIDASTEARMQAVNILTGLYLRKKKQVTSPVTVQQPQAPENPAGRTEQPQSQLQKSQPISAPSRFQEPIMPLKSSENEDRQKKPRDDIRPTKSRDSEARQEQQRGSWKRKLSGWTTSYVDEARSIYLTHERSKEQTDPPSMDSTLGRMPQPYIRSLTQSRSDTSNPWAGAPSMTDSESRRSIYSIQSQQLTRLDTQSSAQLTTISPENKFGGFCQGAYHLQVGLVESALKRKNESVSMTGQGQYYACRGKRCVFEGPAVLYEQGWSYDKNLRTRPGMKYRWLFLAKSHIPQERVRHKLYDFRCLVCVLLGDDSSIFHGAVDLLEHVVCHAGSQLAGINLTGPLMIGNSSIMPAKDDNFDISFSPDRSLSFTDQLSASPTSTYISKSSDAVSADDVFDTNTIFNPRWS